MKTYQLSNITDLVNLDEKDVPQFIADLPGLIATMKLVKAAAAAEGMTLEEAMPRVTFVSDNQQTVTLKAPDATLVMPAEVAVAAAR